jgi:ABC-type amino acid transport system permease subunit
VNHPPVSKRLISRFVRRIPILVQLEVAVVMGLEWGGGRLHGNLVEWAIVLHGMYKSIFSIEMIHNCKKKYTYMPCGQHF